MDNFLFYTVLCRRFLERALRMDLSAQKNAHMLLRMTKVGQLHKFRCEVGFLFLADRCEGLSYTF